jgi:hypothetical protein
MANGTGNYVGAAMYTVKCTAMLPSVLKKPVIYVGYQDAKSRWLHPWERE